MRRKQGSFILSEALSFTWRLISMVLILAVEAHVHAEGPDLAFHEVMEPFPAHTCLFSAPPIAPSFNAFSLEKDLHANYWALVPTSTRDNQLIVLPAQPRSAWRTETVNGSASGHWLQVRSDMMGIVWLAGPDALWRLNPRHVEQGWQNVSKIVKDESEQITAIGLSDQGNLLIALDHGKIGEMPSSGKPEEIQWSSAPKGIVHILCDTDGRIWLKTEHGIYMREAPANAWQRNWKVLSRMPSSNHDISGDVLDRKFYVAGGLTADWGLPSGQQHFWDLLWEYDVAQNSWRTVAELGLKRVFCATSFLGQSIWVIDGDVIEKNKRSSTSLVQICDLLTGTVKLGPPTRFERSYPVAQHLAGRIYVAGFASAAGNDHLKLESIGPGETAWRSEPDGPAGSGTTSAGAVLHGRLYLTVTDRLLAVFNPTNGTWETYPVPKPVRSCQLSHHQGEIWLLGGRSKEGDQLVQIWNPETAKWRNGPELPWGQAWGAAANIDDHLYLFGGARGPCLNEKDYCFSDRLLLLR